MKKILIAVLAVVVAIIVGSYYLFPEEVAGYLIARERDKAGLVKKQITVDDHKIVYLEGGRGPTILLLHGYAANKDNWIRFAPYLKGYHVVIPDIPGYGESTKSLKATYELERQIDRLHRFLKALGINRFHIVGNSMGGWYSAEYALRYPEEVVTVGLFDAAGVISPKKSEVMKMMEKGENPLLLKDMGDLPRLMGLIFVKTPYMPYPLRKMFVEDAVASRSFNEKTLKEIGSDIVSLEEHLPRIDTPTLILWGENDRIIDVSSVAIFEKGLRNHKTVILKQCGHAPMLEKVRETATAYLSFIGDYEIPKRTGN